jgi:hypothetical protein
MLKHWNVLLNTDCLVVGIGRHTVYPIFRVGSSSLFASADKKYINREINQCKQVDILIRDPRDRFISGLQKYSIDNNLSIDDAWRLVKAEKVVDRHFAPQYMWLLHLYKYYRGLVTLRPFEHIKTITDTHINKSTDKGTRTTVPHLETFLALDYPLIKRCGETLELGELIEEGRNALS